MTSAEAILILSQHPKLGAQSIKKILAACDGVIENSNSVRQRVGDKLAGYMHEALSHKTLGTIVGTLNKYDVGYLTIADNDYPKFLKELPDAPAILFIKGSIEVLASTGLSIVGSRKYTAYGARVAKKFSYELSSQGISIVSGLALGIDTIAHRACLDAGGITVGVLACGLDSIYPATNQGLAREIIEAGGAIISEYPIGTEPFRSNFPARNRIIAGLTSGTLVIEAAQDSGALITAMEALDYNREVYAIPGPIDSEVSAGCNHLIKQGAKAVTDPSEILIDYDVKNIPEIRKAVEALPGNQMEVNICQAIENNALSADEIVRMSEYNVAEVSYALTMLEMKGILENVNGFWKKKL